MAGDWIKMRAALMQAPELISMARVLQETRKFRDWLTPGGGAPMNGQIVSDDALRCVTCAALLRVWSASREHGKFDGDDLILPFISVADLDLMAAIPGVGEAMEGVGWVIDEECQLRLPKFKKYNVPPQSNAERQAMHRERNAHSVTGRNGVAVTLPLPEKSRVEKRRSKKKKLPSAPKPVRSIASAAFAEFWAAYPRKLEKQDAERAWQKQGLDALLPDILAALAAFKRCEQWRRDAGQFIPHAATWLNRRQWEDEHPETGGIDPGSMEQTVEIKGNW